MGVVRLAVDEYAAHTRDGGGKPPLHYALIPMNCSPRVEVVHLVMQKHTIAEPAVGTSIHYCILTCASPSAMRVMVETGVDPLNHDLQGRTAINIARTSDSAELREWGRTYGLFLGRYEVVGNPVHVSATCKVLFAKDMDSRSEQQVALKLMRDRDQFEKELNSRRMHTGTALDSRCLVAAFAWHTPIGLPFRYSNGKEPEPQTTMSGAEYPCVLVMERGERSLHDVCAKERLAGYHSGETRSIMAQIARCLQYLQWNALEGR